MKVIDRILRVLAVIIAIVVLAILFSGCVQSASALECGESGCTPSCPMGTEAFKIDNEFFVSGQTYTTDGFSVTLTEFVPTVQEPKSIAWSSSPFGNKVYATIVKTGQLYNKQEYLGVTEGTAVAGSKYDISHIIFCHAPSVTSVGLVSFQARALSFFERLFK